ncbi:MAG: AMP-dependent synthetase/ligase [Actinomycetia bacterium]|nr:AMP-dependent synthetase/ligase [Actinomycetes bacterium]
MREYTSPALAEITAGANISDLVYDNAVKAPHRVQLRRRVGERWEDVTNREFLAEVVALAKGLVAQGVSPGDCVGIMSRTRYEWTLADFAVWCAGGVPVPIYETSSAEQVEWILSDSSAVGVFVETAAHAATVAEVRDQLPNLQHVWSFEAGDLEALVTAGSGISDDEIDSRRRHHTDESPATLIYTSGTTGRPKGCELTHGNFLSEVYNVVASMPQMFNPEGSTLLFLPLAHVFARLIEVGCFHSGAQLGHTADVKNLLPDLATFQPTFILSVPRVFEKVFNSSQAKAAAEGKGKIFDRAAGVAISYSEALDRGGAGLFLKLQHAVFDKLVYSKLRTALGGRVRYAVSGGAPLGARLGHFYRGIGVIILEGYGLTETSAGATLNLPEAYKIGSVGRPVASTSIKIADDGEVMIKGPIVYRGYHNNPVATKEAIEPDGWFHSGDIGELDDEGFLRITGRKKELLVTAGGKNVAPAVLEDRLRAHALVSQCMVVGDNQPYIACLITLDRESLPAWLKTHGKPEDMPIEQVVADPDVTAAIQGAVDDANKAVSNAEAIKKFNILTEDFTEEGGQLTPTLKLKRGVVMAEFKDAVDALYRK